MTPSSEKRGDIDFRPKKPAIDLPSSPEPTLPKKATVRLMGSLSPPGGSSLLSPPTIEIPGLLKARTESRSARQVDFSDEYLQYDGSFYGTKVKADAGTTPKSLSSDIDSGQLPLEKLRREAERLHELQSRRLSFERIDELTRPEQQIEPNLSGLSNGLPGPGDELDWKTDLAELKKLTETGIATKCSARPERLPDAKPTASRIHSIVKTDAPGTSDNEKDSVAKMELAATNIAEESNDREMTPSAETSYHRRDFQEQTATLSESRELETVQESLIETVNAPKRILSMSRPNASSETLVTDLLVTKELKKSYTKGKLKIPVLNGVDFSACIGEFVSIVGQSGSGKSTLLHLLGTLDNPDSGTICFDGRRIDRLPTGERDFLRNHSIGFIFQFYHLLPELTTLENVLSPLMIRESVWGYLTKRRHYIEQGKTILERVGLSHRLNHRPSELSGGEMQRAAIARALVAEPKILLADEPTGNLDSSSAGEIIEILRRLNEEQHLTIVMVTHDNIIAKAADRIVRMVDGVIVEENATTLEDRLLHRRGS